MESRRGDTLSTIQRAGIPSFGGYGAPILGALLRSIQVTPPSEEVYRRPSNSTAASLVPSGDIAMDAQSLLPAIPEPVAVLRSVQLAPEFEEV